METIVFLTSGPGTAIVTILVFGYCKFRIFREGLIFAKPFASEKEPSVLFRKDKPLAKRRNQHVVYRVWDNHIPLALCLTSKACLLK